MPSIAIVGGNPGCLSPAGLDKSGWILVSDILAARSNLAKQLSILVTAANPLADMTRAQSWTLDAQGNWTGLANNGGTAQSRTHNSQNQVTQVGAATLSFDAAGNMTTDEQGRALKYDAWNRLVQVQNGGTTVKYQYDGLKRRITEQIGTAPQRVLYYSASWQVLEERESGVVQAQQVWSPVYVDALILRDRNADGNNTNGPNGNGLEQRHYVAQDANFNVTALIDGSTGAVAERYYYQAYGVPTVLDANFVPRVNGQSQFAWRYLHQGGRFDWAAGLYHFRNRDLSPTLGRWLNHDPIGFEGSKWNLYEYVEGRPTVGLDPSGLIYSRVPIACGPREITYCEQHCSSKGKVASGCACFSRTIWMPGIGTLSNTIAVPTCRDKPKDCGKCTAQELAWLQAAKDLACNGAGKTTPNQACEKLRSQALKNAACAAARQAIQDRCFPGKTDPVHQKLIDDHTQWAKDALEHIKNHNPPC